MTGKPADPGSRDVERVALSVVVPVHDGAGQLAECLTALAASAGPPREVIVVDDASQDDSAAVAARAGARIERLDRNGGAGAARNRGARHATGAVIVFIDADVVVQPDTLARLLRVLDARPELTAVFGSYDTTPRAPGLVSQFRNLLHHFVHQQGAGEAATFWSGCGAIRRAAFESVGGFNERMRAIEDVELGYRLRAAGHRILLDPTIQVTHLKRWTLGSMLWTDAMYRALPWSRVLLQRRLPRDHLNVGIQQRLSVALSLAAAVALGLAPLYPTVGVVSAATTVLGVVVLNRRLLRFFARQRGVGFAAASVLLLLLHYAESGFCFAVAWLAHTVVGRGQRAEP